MEKIKYKSITPTNASKLKEMLGLKGNTTKSIKNAPYNLTNPSYERSEEFKKNLGLRLNDQQSLLETKFEKVLPEQIDSYVTTQNIDLYYYDEFGPKDPFYRNELNNIRKVGKFLYEKIITLNYYNTGETPKKIYSFTRYPLNDDDESGILLNDKGQITIDYKNFYKLKDDTTLTDDDKLVMKPFSPEYLTKYEKHEKEAEENEKKAEENGTQGGRKKKRKKTQQKSKRKNSKKRRKTKKTQKKM
jgi:hypothetical protein